MAAYLWYLQGTTPTTIDVSDIIQFAGIAFGNALFVGSYQNSTHVKTALGVNKSLGNVPHNSRFVSATQVSLDEAANVTLSGSVPTNAQCPIKINFSHGVSVAITNHIIYAYDGAITTNPPTDVTFKIAEKANTLWTTALGSASALAVVDRSAALSHDFYFMVSATPTAVGLKSAFVIRDELIYT